MPECTYCGSDLTCYDPLEVRQFEADTVEGRFCNYGCLAAHIDEADLAVGSACAWEPDAG